MRRASIVRVWQLPQESSLVAVSALVDDRAGERHAAFFGPRASCEASRPDSRDASICAQWQRVATYRPPDQDRTTATQAIPSAPRRALLGYREYTFAGVESWASPQECPSALRQGRDQFQRQTARPSPVRSTLGQEQVGASWRPSPPNGPRKRSADC